MANAKFTERLRAAWRSILDKESTRLVQCKTGSLFSPVYRSGKYEWVKVMDSDGLLVADRKVHPGEGAAPSAEVNLLLGVVLQSEDATAQGKPNPIGKAALAHIPNGIWIDTQEEDAGRRRLDRVLVLFLLPRGAAPNKQPKFATAKRNVLNASDIMPDAVSLEVRRGASATQIAKAIEKEVRPFLFGRGRPASAT